MLVPRLIRIFPFIFLALAGCAAQRAEVAQRARTELVGMPREELLRCAGKPASEEQTRSGEILIYAGSTPDYSCPLKKWAGSEPPRRHCRARFTLERGRVAKVDYEDNSGKAIVTGDQCTFLVEHCVQP